MIGHGGLLSDNVAYLEVLSLLTSFLTMCLEWLIFQHTSAFSAPLLFGSHWLTLKLSASLPPLFLYDREINKLAMALEEGHDVTGRNRLWEGPCGCIMNSRTASPPQMCNVAEIKTPGGTKRDERDISPKLTRLSGTACSGRLEILWQGRASPAS